MEAGNPSNRIHPLMAAAAVSVILVSLTGVAAITGLLPTSHGDGGVPASSATPTAVAPQQVASLAPATPAPTKEALNIPESAPAPKPEKSHAQAHAPRPVKHVQSQPRPVQEPQYVAQAPAVAAPVAETPMQPPVICHSCGTVESVRAVQTPAQGSGVGIAAGAVLGGVLGHQVGGGNGRTLATVAGALGGGYAGNEVEKQARSRTTYEVRVRMEDGNVRTFPYNNQPSWNIGDRIRVVDGYLRPMAG